MADHRLSHVSTASSNNSRRTKAYIGPWQLGKTLGRGSSGRVRLAKHTETDQLAAVKIVSKSQFTNQRNARNEHKQKRHPTAPGEQEPTDVYGIEREVIIMKLIEHPNVMALYDVWENQGELYLVLEYVEGGELFDYLISRGRLSEAEAIRYFRQICYGVDYCHRFNICHRDLKPENLLLDKDRNIKIADFGMAALESGERLLETSCGSPHYASPEIVTGKTYHGAPSDIWSCGIILFALLTGHLPFDDDNIRKLLLKVQAGKYVMPSALSPEAKDIISRMLVVDPAQRITMREILAHPLLRKYPARSVPAQNLRAGVGLDAGQPILKIDKEILRNLQTLWHHDSQESLVRKLRAAEPNTEKTFYMLLMRFRKKHGLQNRLPRHRSTTSMRTLPSSKSIRSIASGKSQHRSASMRSALSVRSVRSTRSVTAKTARTARKSPVKAAIASNPARAHAHRASTAGLASKSQPGSAQAARQPPVSSSTRPQLTQQAEQRTPQKESRVPPSPPLHSRPRAGVERESTANAFAALLDQAFNSHQSSKRETRTASNPAVPPTKLAPAADGKRVFSAPNTHSFRSLDLSLNNPTDAAPQEDKSFLLPMIFEEDRFATTMEHEFNFESSSEDTSTAVVPGLEMPGAQKMSYKPSPAAAAVAKPVRQAPPKPDAQHSPRRAPSGPRELQEERRQSEPFEPFAASLLALGSAAPSSQANRSTPIHVYVDDVESLRRSDSVTRPALAEIPIPNAPASPTGDKESSALTGPQLSRANRSASGAREESVHASTSSAPIKAPTPKVAPAAFKSASQDEELVIPKRAKTHEDSQSSRPAPVQPKEKRNWIRRLTPRLGSRKSSREEARAVSVSVPRAVPVPADDEKENLAAPKRTPTVRQQQSESSLKYTPNGFSEPKQNWVMKMFAGLSQPAVRTVVLAEPVAEIRDRLLVALTNWSPYGLAIRKKDVRGDRLVVTILSTNSLQLKGALVDIALRARAATSTEVRLAFQQGSRHSFNTFCNQVERVLS